MRGERVVVPGVANRAAVLAIRAAPRGALLRVIGSHRGRRSGERPR
jgi:hypothetical protein